MEIEDWITITNLSGITLLTLTAIRAKRKKNKEIKTKLPMVVNALGTKLKRYKPLNDFQEYEILTHLYNNLAKYNEREMIPSYEEWNIAKNLMNKYNLWEKP